MNEQAKRPEPLDPKLDLAPAPLEIHYEAVRPEWIDYNGHMNVAYYVLAFDHATDRMLDLLDLGSDYVGRENKSVFVMETHVNYIQEVKVGDPLRFTLQMIDCDAKRLHYYFEMYHGDQGYLAATSEQIGLHVCLNRRRAEAFPDVSTQRLGQLMAAHGGLERPDQLGKAIGIRRKN